MSNDTNRRDFLGMSFAAVAAVGGAASLIGMKQAWDPLPSVLAAGSTIVDLKDALPGKPSTVTWRGKPIFILKKTADMPHDGRDLVVGEDHFTLAIGLCTHLGCIPAWKKTVWKCACHGGEFDASGRHTFGPPPRPLDIPPFTVAGTVVTLGGAKGPEYEKMIKA
ncbi:MAG: ubiquinol-cytochrome c reductase iron-sulfur subunit [Campylobacterota bacterium]|nr:ubiquinol-cytochrome c reductase iron-sulfur subunit [Campylobacterota bacterium]